MLKFLVRAPTDKREICAWGTIPIRMNGLIARRTRQAASQFAKWFASQAASRVLIPPCVTSLRWQASAS
jgi:hypothetical protein